MRSKLMPENYHPQAIGGSLPGIAIDVNYGVDDYVYFYNWDVPSQRWEKCARCKIRYTLRTNEPYFIHYGSRYYINEFLCSNY